MARTDVRGYEVTRLRHMSALEKNPRCALCGSFAFTMVEEIRLSFRLRREPLLSLLQVLAQYRRKLAHVRGIKHFQMGRREWLGG